MSQFKPQEDLVTLTPVERERPRTRSGRPKSRGSTTTARSGVSGLRDSQYSCDIEAVTALRLNNNTILQGHLFVLHSAAFSEDDCDAMSDAARAAWR